MVTDPESGEPALPGPAVAQHSGPKWHPTGLQVALSLGSLALAALLLAVLFPKASGAGWGESIAAVFDLSWSELALLTGIWILGLWIYTYVYTATLPGLGHLQALTLNLTGSLVSNLLPFGGAAGVANTYALTFSWGFSGVATSTMILVSGLANVLVRLFVPLVGLVALWVSGYPLSGLGEGIALSTLGALVAASVVLIAILLSRRVAAAAGALGDWLLRGLAWLLRRERFHRCLRDDAVQLQRSSQQILTQRWAAITFGMVGYYASETVLFGLALHSLGSSLPWAHIIAAFALSRVLTSVVVTPSGVGISEAGTAGALVLFGVAPPIAAASVLILSFFTYMIEIPAGVAGWGIALAGRGRWRLSRQELASKDSAPDTAG